MSPATLTKAPVIPRTASGGGSTDPPNLPPGSQQPGPDATPEDDWALRCVICNLDWPLIPRLFDYASADRFMALVMESRQDPDGSKLLCPCCTGPVHVANNLNPMSDEEAWSKRNHAEFERFYEQRGERSPLTDEELEKYVNP